jgi:hypothetical protein
MECKNRFFFLFFFAEISQANEVALKRVKGEDSQVFLQEAEVLT